MILKYKALSNRIKIWSFPYLPPGSVRALVCRSMSTLYMSILWIDLTQVGRKKDLFSFDMTLNLLFKVQWLFCPKYFNVALLIKCFFKNVWLFATMFRSDTCIFPNRNFLKANWFIVWLYKRADGLDMNTLCLNCLESIARNLINS